MKYASLFVPLISILVVFGGIVAAAHQVASSRITTECAEHGQFVSDGKLYLCIPTHWREGGEK